MNAADQPSERDTLHNILNRVIRMIRRGRVINGQENPGGALQNKKEQTRRAECIPPVAFWFRTVKQIFVKIIQAKPFIQPIKDFFPHGLAFLVKDLENTVFAHTKFSKTIEWTRWRAAQHFARRVEFGIMTRAKKGICF